MKNIIYSLLAILGCVTIGKIIAYSIGGFPSSLYGLISLTLLLHFKVISAERIQYCIEWAIKNMSVCFVPAGVGIIEHFELIQQHGLTIVAIIFVSTFLLISFIGLIFEKIIHKQDRQLKTIKQSPHL